MDYKDQIQQNEKGIGVALRIRHLPPEIDHVVTEQAMLYRALGQPKPSKEILCIKLMVQGIERFREDTDEMLAALEALERNRIT